MSSKKAKKEKSQAGEHIPRAAAGYSLRTLAKKLGLNDGVSKAILEAPEHFHELIETSEFDTSLDLES
jgi:hypothetical protein